MIREKIRPKLIVGAVQAVISLLAIALALILRFNFFNALLLLDVQPEMLNFDFTILLSAGIIFLIAALFLIYDWWETQS